MTENLGVSASTAFTSPTRDSGPKDSGSLLPRGAARSVASTGDIHRMPAPVDAHRTASDSTNLRISDMPSACKWDSTASAKPWPGAHIKTLHEVVRDKVAGRQHRRVSSATWAEMKKRYDERMQQDKNERLTQEHFWYLCCVLGAVAVIVGIIVLVHFLTTRMPSVPYGTSSRSSVALHDLSELCAGLPTNDTCHGAVRELQRAVDFDADPCRDFHQYACGSWRPMLDGDTSYIAQVTQLFNSVVHDHLLNISFDIQDGKPAPHIASVHQMALFHASCYWMFTGRQSGGNIKDVMEALSINLASWIAVESAESLVELTVSTSLKTGLSAFVGVRLLKGEVLLDVGSAIAKSFVYKPGVRQYLVESVIDLDVNMSNPVGKMMDLDYEVDGRVLASSDFNAFRTLTVQELAGLFPLVNWISAFNLDRPALLPTVTNGTRIGIRGGTFINDVIEIFRQEQHAVIGLYGLLSMLSTVMKFLYYARHVRFEEPFIGVKWCLLLTAWHFSKLYPAWLGATFLSTGSTARFKRAFSEAMAVVLRDNVINIGVYLETTLLSRTWLNIFGEPTYVMPNPADPHPRKMSDAFLPNMAAVIAAQVGTVDRDEMFAESHDFVMGQLGYGQRREGKFAIPPAMVASQGLLSLHVPEVDVGLFAIRYLILRAIYDRAAAYQSGAAPLESRIAVKGSSMADYVLSCFGQSLRRSLNKTLAEDAIKSLMGSRWAVATALAMTDKEAVMTRHLDVRASRRLLFLALCASGCGDPDDAAQCRDMSRVMPEFIDAYGCAHDAEHECGCSALNYCETHQPSVRDLGPVLA